MLLRKILMTLCIFNVTTVRLLDIHIQAYNADISWRTVLKKLNLQVQEVRSCFAIIMIT